ncbi:receptor-type tyrosine-protein phosphatase mu-like isoform X2 [Daphnia carinata]|uniref:receptor-type tyrosine-protein phosphatase mu-like isoform X2 n=1 Tax=Daphnia carinata TaxID=120202 RepID=UPI0028686CB4|nr:receptor-type tyrosine-protein phosphatase mu-like isoform X2 [Daphnia carinata]
MDSSVISDRVNASAEFDVFDVNRTTGDLFADGNNNDIVLHATRVAHSRCCRLTEGVYTLMGCISVTLFFLGVATIKFLSKKYSTPRAARKHHRLLRKYQIAEEGNAMAAIADKPVEVANFVKHCEQRRKYPVLLRVEFQTACKVEGHSTRHGSKPENRPKNQNQKIIPYDYNRVVLDLQPGIPDSDYVNGSYVDSILKPNAYVVTQGPNERTVSDFWRLVWQVHASCIVMLTKTFDFIKVMCVQYWPASKGKEEVYDGITVSYNHEEQLANFVIRNFKITKEGPKGKEERTLLQFHYTEWHSHTCPYSNNIVEFRRRVRAALLSTSITHSTGPMVVHCNDGGGRSGVFMAIDANMELVEEDGLIDIFGYMKKLRQARRGLVETLEQFKFIYDTLEESITCGWSWFPVSELTTRLKQKSIRYPVTKMNEYQREYAQICKLTPRFTIGDCAGGHRSDNRHKNRDVLIIPPDNFRPYLTSFQGNSFTDYINAVFIDGYTRPREYIVTEWPLPHTLGDLWSLVYDYDCSAVVVLTNPPPSSSFPAFWPDGRRSVKYGPVFTVDHVSHNHYPNIKSWIFRINKKDIAPHRRTLAEIVDETRKANHRHNGKIVSLTELMAGVKATPKTCQLFQLMCWPEGHKVPTSTNALVELMNMVERWRQRTDYGPVVVISSDGTSRVGVYFAANACIEQVIQHGEVDVFQAVKNVRRHRPQLVENLTEFKYCYDLVLHYVLHYLHRDGSKK